MFEANTGCCYILYRFKRYAETLVIIIECDEDVVSRCCVTVGFRRVEATAG